MEHSTGAHSDAGPRTASPRAQQNYPYINKKNHPQTPATAIPARNQKSQKDISEMDPREKEGPTAEKDTPKKPAPEIPAQTLPLRDTQSKQANKNTFKTTYATQHRPIETKNKYSTHTITDYDPTPIANTTTTDTTPQPYVLTEQTTRPTNLPNLLTNHQKENKQGSNNKHTTNHNCTQQHQVCANTNKYKNKTSTSLLQILLTILSIALVLTQTHEPVVPEGRYSPLTNIPTLHITTLTNHENAKTKTNKHNERKANVTILTYGKTTQNPNRPRKIRTDHPVNTQETSPKMTNQTKQATTTSRQTRPRTNTTKVNPTTPPTNTARTQSQHGTRTNARQNISKKHAIRCLRNSANTQ